MRKHGRGVVARILFVMLGAGFFMVMNTPASQAQCNVNLLILGDGFSEGQITPFLPANIAWTLAPVLEYNYDGTNPSLTGFDVVLLLDGVAPAYQIGMPTSGQTALVNFVQNGGGFIGTAWLPFEYSSGRYASMAQLIPQTRINGGIAADTYTVITSHPVTACLPSSFGVPNDGMDVSSANSGTAVISGVLTQDAVVVKQFGSGRIVGLATAAGYGGYNPWNTNMQRLLINAIEWASSKCVAPVCSASQTQQKHATPSILPLANTHLAQVRDLMTQANELLTQAEAKNLDTGNCEKLINEATELYDKAKKYNNPYAANYFALQAAKKLGQAIECLKALIG